MNYVRLVFMIPCKPLRQQNEHINPEPCSQRVQAGQVLFIINGVVENKSNFVMHLRTCNGVEKSTEYYKER